MIVQTKNGIMLHGEIAKDPVLRDAGQKQVLKFDLKASRTQDESGKWQSFFVGVNLWHGIDQWDGMLQKGDQVTVFALVTFRWLQQMIDLMAQSGPPLEPAEPAAEPEGLQGAQMYPGESLADYAPHSTSSPEAATSAEYDPINEDAEDLPF